MYTERVCLYVKENNEIQPLLHWVNRGKDYRDIEKLNPKNKRPKWTGKIGQTILKY